MAGDDLAAADPGDASNADIGLSPARLAAGTHSQASQHAVVPEIPKLLNLDLEVLPGLVETKRSKALGRARTRTIIRVAGTVLVRPDPEPASA
jgi:hypothetical protein